jgi:signal transduction histidine kinase
VVQQFLAILFGLENTAVFLLEEGGVLRGQAAGAQDRRFADLAIRLAPERSLLSDAVSQREILDSFLYLSIKRKLNVIDRQLIRLCGRSGLLALPMVARNQAVGVVTAGIDLATLESIQPFLPLLALFMIEAAELVLRQREEEESHQLAVAEGQAQLESSLRKVRHEASNPLGVVANYLHILGTKLGSDSPLQSELGILKEEIERVGTILDRLTEQVATAAPVSDTLDANDTIARLHSILMPALLAPRGIEAELDLDPALPPVRGGRDELRQVFVNLVKNAAEAMPEGGRLTVTTRADLLNERGRYVELRVRDTGPGLPEAVRGELFRPVASKKGGGHAGLGLSITAQLVRELRGTIQCRTGAEGTEFIVLLPAQN